MKQSHYTTPRSLSECYFDPRGQAVFGTPSYGNSMTAYVYIGAVILLCLVAMFVIII